MADTMLEIKIATAIHTLISDGVKPSQRKVIELIGKGSLSTIGPIFNSIKDRFGNFTDPDALCKHYKLKRHNANHILHENTELKTKVALLEQHNITLEGENLDLKQRLAKVIADSQETKKLYQELKEEREAILNQIKEEKDKQIASLLEELAATHREHSKSFGDFVFSIDDKVMQKEVELLNLRSKLKELQDKLKTYQENDIPHKKRMQQLAAENATLVTRVVEFEKQLKESVDGS